MKDLLVLTVALLALSCSPGAARDVPGGANQATGVEGSIMQMLFNGEARLKLTAIRFATQSEIDAVSPENGKRVIVVTAIMSNGTHEQFNGVFEYSLVDSDGVAISSEERYVEPNPPPNAPPGGAWHEKVSFIVPSDFKPTKLVVIQTVKTNSDDAAKAFRIHIDPTAIH